MKTIFDKLSELEMTIVDNCDDEIKCYHQSAKTLVKSEVEAMLREIIAEPWLPREDEGYVKAKTIIKIAAKHGFEVK